MTAADETPLAAAGHPRPEAIPHGTMHNETMERDICTILIVEDEVITGMDIHRMLSKHG